MRYKLFVFDLDETLWTISEGLCSLIKPPFRMQGDTRLETNEGYWVELKPGVHDLFKFLKKKKCFISLASRNDVKSVMALLEAFKLDSYIVYPQLGWRPKEESIQRILKEIQKKDKVAIKPSEVFFLDDWPENVVPVRGFGATALVYGQDVESYAELIDMLK